MYEVKEQKLDTLIDNLNKSILKLVDNTKIKIYTLNNSYVLNNPNILGNSFLIIFSVCLSFPPCL